MIPGSWEYYLHTNREKDELNSEKRHDFQALSNRKLKESRFQVPYLQELDALSLEQTLLKW